MTGHPVKNVRPFLMQSKMSVKNVTFLIGTFLISCCENALLTLVANNTRTAAVFFVFFFLLGRVEATYHMYAMILIMVTYGHPTNTGIPNNQPHMVPTWLITQQQQ